MKKIQQTIQKLPKTFLACLIVAVFVLVGSLGMHIARAVWEEPQAQAPGGNVYAPLNTGSAKQAKAGYLLLDPAYIPDSTLPTMNYPLEVHGAASFINYLDITGNLTVDPINNDNTLFVNASSDPAAQRVGIGTITPSAKLDVVNGVVSVGKSGSAVTKTAITATTSGSAGDSYGAYASSQAAGNIASVYGYSNGLAGVGVYGVNTSSGAGVYGESASGSGVVGVSTAVYDPYTKVAGIYGATGATGWAGYFQQRLYSTNSVIGRKFTPNRLATSLVPYTANWQTQVVSETARSEPAHPAFDGRYLWVAHISYDQNIVSVINPSTGALITEIQDNDNTRGIQKMMFADGYMWGAKQCGSRPCLVKFDVNNFTVLGTYDMDTRNGTAVDLVSDGAGRIWTANYLSSGSPRDSISRFIVATNTRDQIVRVSLSCGSALTEPTGVTYDSTNVWVSFRGPAGIVKIDGTFTPTAYCTVPNNNRQPSDIAYDSHNGGRIWIANGSAGNNGGIGKYRMDGTLETEYLASTPVYQHFTSGLAQIQYDGQSSGGPYVWMNRIDAAGRSLLFKFNIDTATITHEYSQSVYMLDFAMDRTTVGGPYVWSVFPESGEISRAQIDAPYALTYFVIRGYRGMTDIAFDGTYIWTVNSNGSTISKFRAVDGKKIGDYMVGTQPTNIEYDGQYLWIVTNADSNNKNLIKVRPVDGAVVGEYQRQSNIGGKDAIYDGRDLWITHDEDRTLERIRLSNCVPANLTCSGAGTAVYTPQQASGDFVEPNKIIFDGTNLWVSHGVDGQANRISKISYTDAGITVAQTYTYPTLYGGIFGGLKNISAMEYDGTYIWIGTMRADSNGNSIFKISASDGSIVSNVPVYLEPGRCSAGAGRPNQYCRKDADCNGGTCQASITAGTFGCEGSNDCLGRMAGIRTMVFDGINMWAFSVVGTDYSIARECGDNIDNNNDSLCDRDGCCNNNLEMTSGQCATAGATWLLPDTVHCAESNDLHEASRCSDGQDNDSDGLIDAADPDCQSGGVYQPNSDAEGAPECSDGIDNDGNGLCDFNGAIGHPGCSGKPDLGCSSANDISEAVEHNDAFLSRVVAVTGQVADTIDTNEHYFSAYEMIYDGNHIWYGGTKYHSLAQYYSGSGLGLTGLDSSVNLLGSNALRIQPGSFWISGSATLGGSLTVVGDLVVSSNTWPGVDSSNNFGTGCPNGQFAKTVTIDAGVPANNRIVCRGL